MGERMIKNLVSQSLFRAVAEKRPPRGLIHHSDCGSQYCAHASASCLTSSTWWLPCRCGEIAVITRRWELLGVGLLKNELVHHRKFKTRAEAIEAITDTSDLPAATYTGAIDLSIFSGF